MAVVQNWKFNNTALQTLAFNISSHGGRARMANRRGQNIVVPYRHGRIWTPKFYDENQLTLAMWVLGANPTTGVPDTDPESKMWENLQTLQRLFTTDRALGTLTKTHPVENKAVSALAEVADVIDFRTQAGATRAAFIVDLILPDVWFEFATNEGETGLTSRADTDDWDLIIDSDVPIFDAIIHLKAVTGTPSNVTLTNTTLGTDHWIKYADVFVTGEEVIIDVGAWTAELDAVTNVINNVQWSGQPQFFQLVPGTNNIEIAVTGGPVSVQIEAKGKYW